MTKEVSGGAGNIIYALKAAVFSFAATFAVLFICALAAVYTAATDSVISLMTAASSCYCTVFNRMYCARKDDVRHCACTDRYYLYRLRCNRRNNRRKCQNRTQEKIKYKGELR